MCSCTTQRCLRSEAVLRDARETVRVVVRAEAAHPLTRRVVCTK
jgi:hypothetical protein